MSSQAGVLRVRARWVLPVTAAPIANGEVVVQDGMVMDVRETPHGPIGTDAVLELGDAVVLPGLINAHTHIEYTVMRGLLEDMPFLPWIRELTARKAALSPPHWAASAVVGAAEAALGGVTTIADCTDSGAALDGAEAVGLRSVVYQEVFGIDEAKTVDEKVAELDAKVTALRERSAGGRASIGISPHSPYTVRPSLLDALVHYAASRDLPLCVHAAESRQEAELVRYGIGEIADALSARGIVWEAPGTSTVQYLDSLGVLGPRTLLVHGCQVGSLDRETIRSSGAAWVLCPKSNAKLGAGMAPYRLLRSAYPRGEAHIGLGSDSVASNNRINMFEEMRFFVLLHRASRRAHDAPTARDAVDMATIGGARALGLAGVTGALAPGLRADLCGVSLRSPRCTPAYDPYAALVYSASAADVSLTMVDGEVIARRGRLTRPVLGPAMRRIRAAANRMARWQPTS